jgi:uncharacterized protein DUF892
MARPPVSGVLACDIAVSLCVGTKTCGSPLPIKWAKQQKNLRELFHGTLKDIYFAEKKILTALPKMAKAAHCRRAKGSLSKA